MPIQRRVLWISAGLATLIALAIACYRFSGSTAVESWAGAQLLDVGGSYLEPTLRFDSLTYVQPRTIVVDHLTLSSPDPSQPGSSVVIFAVKRARLELTEVPRRGQPLKFSEIILESPEIHAIASTPGRATLVGFSKLLKSAADSQSPAGAASKADSHAPSPQLKPSDFLLIRHISIKDGTFSYDSRAPNASPLSIDGINAELFFSPADASKDHYALNTTISRPPAFELVLQGTLNIDTLILDLAKLDFNLDLREQNAHFLPPELQKLLHTFEVTGALHVTAAGTLPLGDWRQSTLQTTGLLTAAQVATGENRLTIDALNWDADVASGVMTLHKADARLLGGTLHLTGTLPLDPALPVHVAGSGENLQIQRLLRNTKPGDIPPYAGNLSANISYSAPLAHWNTQAHGGGTFSIRQGRIDQIPVLGDILTSLSKFLAHPLSGDHDLNDAADGRFSFAQTGVRVEEFSGTSGIMAVRGTGTIGFDQQLDMRLNGGPMEGLQNSLGDLGRAWASTSDAMAGYRVNGTAHDPHVSIEMGGGR